MTPQVLGSASNSACIEIHDLKINQLFGYIKDGEDTGHMVRQVFLEWLS